MELSLSSHNIVQFEPKRIDWLHDLGRFLTANLLHTQYSFHFEGMEHIKPLEKQGFILLPRHGSYFDVVVESKYIHRAIDRRAYYTMKSTLPDFLEYFGGIKVLRRNEVMQATREERRHLLDQEERMRALVKHGELRGKAFVDPVVAGLLDLDEIVVLHPEGGIPDEAQFSPRKDLVTRLTKLKTKKTPVFVPFDIRYYEGDGRNAIYAYAGEPLETRDPQKLYTHLKNCIPEEYKHLTHDYNRHF